jgi:hypothetical protein
MVAVSIGKDCIVAVTRSNLGRNLTVGIRGVWVLLARQKGVVTNQSAMKFVNFSICTSDNFNKIFSTLGGGDTPQQLHPCLPYKIRELSRVDCDLVGYSSLRCKEGRLSP